MVTQKLRSSVRNRYAFNLMIQAIWLRCPKDGIRWVLVTGSII